MLEVARRVKKVALNRTTEPRFNGGASLHDGGGVSVSMLDHASKKSSRYLPWPTLF